MVAKESANPTKKHLMQLADYFKVKNASSIIDQVQNVIYNWKMYANECEVSTESKNRIAKVIGQKS